MNEDMMDDIMPKSGPELRRYIQDELKLSGIDVNFRNQNVISEKVQFALLSYQERY